METFYYFYSAIDPVFMHFYRIPDNPLLGYFLGTSVLSLACIVIGKCSITIAFMLHKKRIEYYSHEIRHYQKLSIEALKIGDKTTFKACNRIANDAYGNNFFAQVALSAASLWPVFIALGWMQYRFADVKFILPLSLPGGGNTIGYVAFFLICYISIRILLGQIKDNLPYFLK